MSDESHNPPPLSQDDIRRMITHLNATANTQYNQVVPMDKALADMARNATAVGIADSDEFEEAVMDQDDITSTSKDGNKNTDKAMTPAEKEQALEESACAKLEINCKLVGEFQENLPLVIDIVADYGLGSETEPKSPYCNEDAPPIKPHQAQGGFAGFFIWRVL